MDIMCCTEAGEWEYASSKQSMDDIEVAVLLALKQPSINSNLFKLALESVEYGLVTNKH